LKELTIGDITKKTSLKYSINFKIYTANPPTDEETLIEKCKEAGKKS
jgi:hypothetical protein